MQWEGMATNSNATRHKRKLEVNVQVNLTTTSFVLFVRIASTTIVCTSLPLARKVTTQYKYIERKTNSFKTNQSIASNLFVVVMQHYLSSSVNHSLRWENSIHFLVPEIAPCGNFYLSFKRIMMTRP